MSLRRLRTLWVLVLFSLHFGVVRSEAPDWALTASKQPAPQLPRNPPAVILLEEEIVEVDESGEMQVIQRGMIRLLASSGSKWANAGTAYNAKAEKIKNARAWVLRNGKMAHEKKKKEWVDASAADNLTITSEMRQLQINLYGLVAAGDVFAYEICLARRKVLLSSFIKNIGSELPIDKSSFTISVPPGFTIKSTLFGDHLPDEERSGNNTRYSCTLRNTPYRPIEPFASASYKTDCTIFIEIVPPTSATQYSPRLFSSWKELNRWMIELNSGVCDTHDELTAKVQALTAGCADKMSKIRAISSYVQNLRYVANDNNLAMGDGYVARKASLVYSRGFGDCKDKSNLLRAMLREAGIKSYTAVAQVYRWFDVREEIITPTQFNHEIICIEAPDSAPESATLDVPSLGKFIVFDPTDKYTSFGYIPKSLQGSKILLQTEETNNLIVIPNTKAEAGFNISRNATIVLSDTAIPTVKARLVRTGYYGSLSRRAYEDATSPAKLETYFRSKLSDGLSNSTLIETQHVDDPVSGECIDTLQCTGNKLVQAMPNGMTVVKMEVFSRDNLPSFPQNERHLPISLVPTCIEDTLSLTLPSGKVVEEMPMDAKIESPYGSYELRVSQAPGSVELKRKVLLHKADYPVSEYAKIRKFLNDIAKADRCSVILR